MLRQYELVERVRSYDPDANEDLLNRAYVFSMKAHGSQLRASGDPYFSHPIEVAGILTDLRLDDETIATAILHDTIEDTVATSEDIERLFGANVARLVEGVTKLSRIEAQSDTERAAENLRRFLLAMSDDIRVLMVKLADRLHNMRTLHFLKNPEKRRRIARETLDIYAPLAERIGLYSFMDELAELSFEELEPEALQSIRKRLATLKEDGVDVISRIESRIRYALEDAGMQIEDVRGREKRPWSIWRKMQERDITFETLSDVMAFRVITRNPEDCYRALGVLHMRWPTVPGRFKDYISTPKSNGYRSLHTTLLDQEKLRIEVQIRDQEMHLQAEYGMAAHWSYKQKQSLSHTDYPWLADLLEILDHAQTAEEVLEHTRIAMFQDKLFCFTPKGEIIQLPKGATAVDFAYAVHTTLGDTCVGARVNGKVVPLRTRLENGDQVDILSSSAQTPDPAWEQFVVTAKARSAVRRHIRNRERSVLLKTGQAIYDNVVDRLKIEVSSDILSEALRRLKLADQEALFIALSKQIILDNQLMEALLPGSGSKRRSEKRKKPQSPERAILIDGDVAAGGLEMGQCCMPVPGERIVGIGVPGHGITVHAIDCRHLRTADDDHWIDLKWAPDAHYGTARLEIVVENEPGALAQVTDILARKNVNIVNLQLLDRDRSHHHFVMDAEVDSLRHLSEIIASLRVANLVVSAKRLQT